MDFSSEAAGKGDPYVTNFSKTDASAMSSMMKNGSLDFGDLKSGNTSSNFNASPGFQNENEKHKISSPRSPVGRTDKPKNKDFMGV